VFFFFFCFQGFSLKKFKNEQGDTFANKSDTQRRPNGS